jgi:hypothetical protein
MRGPEEFVVAGHEVLFREEPGDACDVCGRRVEPDDDAVDFAPQAIAGRGHYMWARGDEVRREEPPLCPSCAAALGLTALARWEIEEEEG